MIKKVLCIALVLGLTGVAFNSASAKKQEPAVSTQGVEDLDQDVINSKPAPEENYDLKAKIKARKQYFKYKKKIKKQDKLRTKTINEIEYLNKRMEVKKKQLESFNPPSESEKGDEEE